MIAIVGSGISYINCNRTCSTTDSYDTCCDNPNSSLNKQIHVVVLTYPDSNKIL